MNDYTRKQTNSECQPAENPAPQPAPGDGACGNLPETKLPEVKKPECEGTKPECECPKPPGSTPSCLDDLITEQTVAIDASDKAAKFKKELEDLLTKAKAARAAYTQEKYERLVEEWVNQDTAIAKLIKRLLCKVRCWDCILHCYVCPLLNDLHIAEKWLYDDGKKAYELDVRNLNDQRYWLTRDRDAKQRTFDRIKNILAAWEKPAETIEKALADNKKLYDGIDKGMETAIGKAIFDLFLRLIPMHLAIAPRKEVAQTKIEAKYTEFCKCGDHAAEICCGINVGERSFRDRLIGPQPSLIDPAKYFDLICCLVKNRYVTAQASLSKAESDLLEKETLIANLVKQIGTGWEKDFETAAVGAIPGEIDCCDYDPKPKTETITETETKTDTEQNSQRTTEFS